MSDMNKLAFSPSAVRAMDRTAIEQLGIPGYTLMTRAGMAAFDDVRRRFPDAQRWLIVCGAGNNAGDGFVVGRLGRVAGLDVTVSTVSDPGALTGDAEQAFNDYVKAHGRLVDFEPTQLNDADLVIDAMLGTGLDRPLEGLYRQAAEGIRDAATTPVVALDIPTGINGETGHVMGAAVRADLTSTFVGLKQGLFLADGPEYSGEICFHDLGIPADALASIEPTLEHVTDEDAVALLARRARSAHKGRFGHVLIVGGNRGMGGAARLAGEAALRSGAGLVSVAAHPEVAATLNAGRPELMCHGVQSPEDLDELLDRATVVALGPGLGRDEWAQQVFRRVLAGSGPLVVDADGLNLLAATPTQRDNWILTPHPGEAARLSGRDTAAVQEDRLGTLDDIAARYGGVVVLKGQGTLVGASGGTRRLVTAGNPGMATAGMGDVLTGIVAGILAQFPNDQIRAAAIAVLVHARAGDLAAAQGERGLIASDLFAHLRAVINSR